MSIADRAGHFANPVRSEDEHARRSGSLRHRRIRFVALENRRTVEGDNHRPRAFALRDVYVDQVLVTIHLQIDDVWNPHHSVLEHQRAVVVVVSTVVVGAAVVVVVV